MDGNPGNAMASTSQSRKRLVNRGGENDKMSRGVWKAVETSTKGVGMGETEGGRSRKKAERKE